MKGNTSSKKNGKTTGGYFYEPNESYVENLKEHTLWERYLRSYQQCRNGIKVDDPYSFNRHVSQPYIPRGKAFHRLAAICEWTAV